MGKLQDPEVPGESPSQSPGLMEPMPGITTSSTSMCPTRTLSSGATGGNPDHNREQYLSQKDHTFKAKLKWHDGYEGHGEHYFDYNHVGPKEPVHHAPAYAPPKPAYGGPALTN